MPVALAKRLRKEPNMSACIADAIQRKFSEEEKIRKEDTLAMAYQNASIEDVETNRDWDGVAGDSF